MKNDAAVKPFILLTESTDYGTHYLKARFVHLSEADGKPRNYSLDFGEMRPYHALYLEDLGIDAHWYETSTSKTSGEWTSHEVCYYSPYQVTEDLAVRMIKTLKILGKRMTMANTAYGMPRDFGEILTRFGAAVGVGGYLIYQKGHERSMYTDSEFTTMTAPEIRWHIARRAESLNAGRVSV